jgi:uncharacterized protein YutE (UPF0331/DUF86 family)
MADLTERIAVEIENIEHVLAELPDHSSCSGLSMVELAGVAALLHNFYQGIEKILQQIVLSRGLKLPTGSSWHRDLVDLSVSNGFVSEAIALELRAYLAFRHFFSHAYVLDLDVNRIEPLVEYAQEVFQKFIKEIKKVVN